MEDLAYRRLLDLYYLREAPLPADIQATAKLIRMRSMAADVEAVLNEFFVLTNDGWAHARCDEEIMHMQDKQAKARSSAAASVKARQAKAERVSSTSAHTSDGEKHNERSTDVQQHQANAELPTPTPTPTPVDIVGRAKRRTRIDPNFLPNETGLNAAQAKALRVEIELPKFRDYHLAKGSTMVDWQAAWRTWVGNARPSPSATLATETAYQRSMRERYEEASGKRRQAVIDITPTTLELSQ